MTKPQDAETHVDIGGRRITLSEAIDLELQRWRLVDLSSQPAADEIIEIAEGRLDDLRTVKPFVESPAFAEVADSWELAASDGCCVCQTVSFYCGHDDYAPTPAN